VFRSDTGDCREPIVSESNHGGSVNYKISRRAFITSTGAVFTLPLLESMFRHNSLWAAAVADPKRYVLFYFPNGTYNRPDKPIWMTPSDGAITAGNTSPALSPFAANYADITSINYLKNDAWFGSPINGYN